ncbi:hypothetical protein OG462_43440 [Streptomyces sp. NBC_01077]|uniref:hypothetical protein n=1 Tax=Streptomyces sp. NBC_01077 TaxID=2903746 RepID=UPI0038650AAF|nr:hypothetical protein OG462_01565 [Streptomyces sp. NBC_01077]WSV43626.1 hypothetical protein OG462_43440 [Streptomyces sp. NBC_01077]
MSDGGPRKAPEPWAARRPDEHARGDLIVTAPARHTGSGHDGTDGLLDPWTDLDIT